MSAGAKLVGNYGMQALLDDTTAIYVQDTTPTSESRYRTRFYFDPNSLSMTSGDLHTIFEASNGPYLVFYINFKYSTTSGYQLKLKVRRDDGTYAETSYYTISDAPHFVEVDWQGATTAGANNGAGTLWIDGILQEALSGIDDDTLRVESVKLGAVSGLDAIGTNKTYYFDSFDSRRVNPLGPDVTVGSGRNSVTGLIGGQQIINNTPIFSGAMLPHTRGMSSYPTPSGPTIFATTTYSYAAQSATCPDGALTKPHAVTSAGSDTYCYDKNGNMVKRVENGTTYTQTFDAENRLSSVTVGGVTTTFVYDGDGNLVKKVKGTTTTVYLGAYEVELTNSVVTKKTSYYPGGAMRVDIVGGTNTVYYFLKDHLGSASTLLDASGNPVSNGEQRYYPFGESRITGADLKTNHLFTGQRSFDDLGIYHYNARAYSPRLGRFLSADTIVPEPGNPQALNRYSYVNNDPLRYTDSTGHYADCDNPAPGYNDAYTNPDGGVFSQADCWAYNAILNDLIDAGVELDTIDFGSDEDDDDDSNDICDNYQGTTGVATCTVMNWQLDPFFFLGQIQITPVSDDILKPLLAKLQGKSDSDEEAEGSGGGGNGGGGGRKGGRKRLDKLIKAAQSRYPKLAEKIHEHHVHPKYLGGDPKGKTVALDSAYHQMITNEFRQQWPYGQGRPSKLKALEIMKTVYKKFPLP